MELILGSQSAGRQYILSRAGFTYKTMSADIDEKAIRSDDYLELPLLIARAKAAALVSQIAEPSLLITSDQVVAWNGELREKPESKEQAREYLKSYALHPAQANTAVVVTNTKTGKNFAGVETSKIYFDKIPEDVISQLIDAGDIMYCAGGFKIQDPLLAPYITSVEGERDNIIGLPMTLTRQLLEQAGYTS